MITRRHHCRYCKNSFCGNCSKNKSAIPEQNVKTQVRVCNSCRDIIKGTRTELLPDIVLGERNFDYDFFVIGGGSGGLACAKEVAKISADKNLGLKVGLADYVAPSPQGTTWGVGGTCVNVGCIPKKLMHHASLLGDGMHDSAAFGWDVTRNGHSWEKLVEGVQSHIIGLNGGYIKQMQDAKITYYNKFAKFKGKHKLELRDSDGKTEEVTCRRILLAVGGRPNIVDVPGAKECCITSDDIFSLKKNPGQNVLVIGASYVALECAGFLTGLGHNVTVMVRSILLRGFDQEVAVRIGKYMEKMGTNFLWGYVPTQMKKEKYEGKDVIRVGHMKKSDDEKKDELFDVWDTVLVATGRTPCTRPLGLCCAGVMRNIKNRIPVFQEQTNVPNIYALGDVAALKGGKVLELTPVAIQAGKLLAARLFGGSMMQMDYDYVATTVFTPLEYGCCGLTEEEARKEFGEDNVEVYHQIFQPLEMVLPDRMNREDSCYCKIVIHIEDMNKVVGFHFLGPNAGEVTQGFALSMKMGATFADYCNTVGIHPTNAENFTTLTISKGSGLSAEKEDC